MSQPPLSFSHAHTERDMRQLQRLLKELVQGQELEKLGPRKLIDIACGRADETGILRNVFGSSDQMEIIGADIRDREISEACERWQDDQTRFLVHDGTKLNDVDALKNADLAFLRHQNYWNGRETWERIFEQSISQLNEDGHLIITSYFDREHQLAKQALEQQGLVLVNEVQNERSRNTGDVAGKSVDRWVALFRKADSSENRVLS